MSLKVLRKERQVKGFKLTTLKAELQGIKDAKLEYQKEIVKHDIGVTRTRVLAKRIMRINTEIRQKERSIKQITERLAQIDQQLKR
jgi:hypothetical protein